MAYARIEDIIKNELDLPPLAHPRLPSNDPPEEDFEEDDDDEQDDEYDDGEEGQDDDGTLEALLAEVEAEAETAKRARASERLAKRALATKATQKVLDSTFKDPSNWHMTANVNLVERIGETQTFIGVFAECVHNWIPSARKLTRTEYPHDLLPYRTEYIDGASRLEPHRTWDVLSLPYREIGVYAYLKLEGMEVMGMAQITLRVGSEGQILQASVDADTALESDNMRLIIPARFDVWPTLTRIAKVNIHSKLMPLRESGDE